MKPAKCKICEHEHWGLAHVFDDVATKPVATRKPKAEAGLAALGRQPTPVSASRPESARVQKWREANREKYNERMRVYRKRKKPLGVPYD